MKWTSESCEEIYVASLQLCDNVKGCSQIGDRGVEPTRDRVHDLSRQRSRSSKMLLNSHFAQTGRACSQLRHQHQHPHPLLRNRLCQPTRPHIHRTARARLNMGRLDNGHQLALIGSGTSGAKHASRGTVQPHAREKSTVGHLGQRGRSH